MRDRRWKILVVVEATAAGVGRHVSDLTSNLNLERFDVSVAWSPVRSDQRFRDTVENLEARGVHTYAISMSRGIDPRADVAALLKLIGLIRREQFDLVHVHSSKAGFLGRVAAAVAKPSAVRIYSPNAISIPLNRAYWYPEKFAGLFTDALVAVSQSEREELSGYKLVPSRKLFRVTAGIPLSGSDGAVAGPIREELGVPRDAILIGTVGRVSYQKDPETFLAAAERVIRATPAAYFVWIGPGEDLKATRETAEKLGISGRVRFTGYRKDAQHLLQAVDIFLLTSRYESFGYATCEAMGFGKPVVASRVTGSNELVIEDETGFLVNPGDAAGFAQALQRLIDSDTLRRDFGSAGRRRVEQHFSLERMISETEQLYSKLLGNRRRSAEEASAIGQSAEAK